MDIGAGRDLLLYPRLKWTTPKKPPKKGPTWQLHGADRTFSWPLFCLQAIDAEPTAPTGSPTASTPPPEQEATPLVGFFCPGCPGVDAAAVLAEMHPAYSTVIVQAVRVNTEGAAVADIGPLSPAEVLQYTSLFGPKFHHVWAPLNRITWEAQCQQGAAFPCSRVTLADMVLI